MTVPSGIAPWGSACAAGAAAAVSAGLSSSGSALTPSLDSLMIFAATCSTPAFASIIRSV